ncbi:hypothetical protein PspLS_05660 [Pyricularia sp. CBS 133598]|nr:hypothetical protein PspLS_05660 [Pyricularia sp. CBS 133598]
MPLLSRGAIDGRPIFSGSPPPRTGRFPFETARPAMASSSPPSLVSLPEPSGVFMALGMREMRQAIEAYGECELEGHDLGHAQGHAGHLAEAREDGRDGEGLEELVSDGAGQGHAKRGRVDVPGQNGQNAGARHGQPRVGPVQGYGGQAKDDGQQAEDGVGVAEMILSRSGHHDAKDEDDDEHRRDDVAVHDADPLGGLARKRQVWRRHASQNVAGGLEAQGQREHGDEDDDCNEDCFGRERCLDDKGDDLEVVDLDAINCSVRVAVECALDSCAVDVIKVPAALEVDGTVGDDLSDGVGDVLVEPGAGNGVAALDDVHDIERYSAAADQAHADQDDAADTLALHGRKIALVKWLPRRDATVVGAGYLESVGELLGDELGGHNDSLATNSLTEPGAGAAERVVEGDGLVGERGRDDGGAVHHGLDAAHHGDGVASTLEETPGEALHDVANLEPRERLLERAIDVKVHGHAAVAVEAAGQRLGQAEAKGAGHVSGRRALGRLDVAHARVAQVQALGGAAADAVGEGACHLRQRLAAQQLADIEAAAHVEALVGVEVARHGVGQGEAEGVDYVRGLGSGRGSGRGGVAHLQTFGGAGAQPVGESKGHLSQALPAEERADIETLAGVEVACHGVGQAETEGVDHVRGLGSGRGSGRGGVAHLQTFGGAGAQPVGESKGHLSQALGAEERGDVESADIETLAGIDVTGYRVGQAETEGVDNIRGLRSGGRRGVNCHAHFQALGGAGTQPIGESQSHLSQALAAEDRCDVETGNVGGDGSAFAYGAGHRVRESEAQGANGVSYLAAAGGRQLGTVAEVQSLGGTASQALGQGESNFGDGSVAEQLADVDLAGQLLDVYRAEQGCRETHAEVLDGGVQARCFLPVLGGHPFHEGFGPRPVCKVHSLSCTAADSDAEEECGTADVLDELVFDAAKGLLERLGLGMPGKSCRFLDIGRESILSKSLRTLVNLSPTSLSEGRSYLLPRSRVKLAVISTASPRLRLSCRSVINDSAVSGDMRLSRAACHVSGGGGSCTCRRICDCLHGLVCSYTPMENREMEMMASTHTQPLSKVEEPRCPLHLGGGGVSGLILLLSFVSLSFITWAISV